MQDNNIEIFQMITTDDSYHEGLNAVDEYVKTAKELGIKSLAIVDKNSMAMHVKFQKKCNESDIKPIFGATLTLDYPTIDYANYYLQEKNKLSFIFESQFLEENHETVDFSSFLNIDEEFTKEKLDILKRLKRKAISFKKSKASTKKATFLKDLHKELYFFGESNKAALLSSYNPIDVCYLEEKAKAKKLKNEDEYYLAAHKSYFSSFLTSLYKNKEEERLVSYQKEKEAELKKIRASKIELTDPDESEFDYLSEQKEEKKVSIFDEEKIENEDNISALNDDNEHEQEDEYLSFEENFQENEEIIKQELKDLIKNIDKTKSINELILLSDSFNLSVFEKQYLLSVCENVNFNNVERLNIEKAIDYDNFIEKLLLVSEKLPRSDIVIIAKNNDGYFNLKKLISEAYLHGQYDVETSNGGKREINSYPLTKLENLYKNKDGLFIISRSNKNDVLGKNIHLGGNASIVANELKKLFGNQFVIALSKNYKFEQIKYVEDLEKINSKMFNLASDLAIPALATTDARFAKESQYDTFDLKSAMLLGEIKYSLNRVRDVYSGQHLISNNEITSIYSNYEQLLINNETILNQCNAKLRLGFSILPDFDVDESFSRPIYERKFKELGLTYDNNYSIDEIKSILKNYYTPLLEEKFGDLVDVEVHKTISNIICSEYMIYVGWKGVLENLKKDYPNEDWESKIPEYKERFDYEAGIINNMGFSAYFLIVYDFINFAKTNNIPVGVGRGSGAGSLVAYGLKITGIDPIPYKLFFERFLNPERVSMPDFDIDFSQSKRDLVIEYVKNKYGNTTQIATHGTYKAKSVLKAIAKALGHTITNEDYLVELIDSKDIGFKLNDFYEDENAIERIENEISFSDKLKTGILIENKKQNSGVHAGGVAMASGDMNNFSAVQCAPDGSSLVTQFDKTDIEYAGLVKFDFLGLKTLDIVDEACNQVLNNKGISIDIEKISLKDQKTYDLIKAGLTKAVFQLESEGMVVLAKRLQVENIEEISALVALYRPGPINSGMTEEFVLNKQSGDIELMDDSLEEALNYTYGSMIYQEQVMQAAQIIAGYTLGAADQLRRAMGKKNIDEMKRHQSIFINGSTKYNCENLTKEYFSMFNEKIYTNLSGYDDLKRYLSDDGLFSFQDKFEEFLLNEVYDQNKALVEIHLNYVFNKDYKYKILLNDYNKNYDNSEEQKKFTEQKEFFNRFKDIVYKKYENKKAKEILAASYAFAKYGSIFFKIEMFAGYGFNKSHSLSYGIISYQTAYLKANYPSEFYASVCSFNDDLDKINNIIQDMKNFDVELLKPSINSSNYKFRAIDNKVRFGFSALKGLGTTGKIIQEERELNGNYKNLTDLLIRYSYRAKAKGEKNIGLSLSNFDSLLNSGCLDEFYSKFINEKNAKSVRGFIKKEYLILKEFIKNNEIKFNKIEELYNFRIKNGFYPKNEIMEKNEDHNPLINIMLFVAALGKDTDLFFNESNIDKENQKIKLKEFKEKVNKYAKFLSEKNVQAILNNENFKNQPVEFLSNIASTQNEIVSVFREIYAFSKKHVPEFNFVEIQNYLKKLKELKINTYYGDDYLIYSYMNKDSYDSFESKGIKILKHLKTKSPAEHYEIFKSKIEAETKIDDSILFEKEKATAGVYLTGHPVEINNIDKEFAIERSDRLSLGDIMQIAESDNMDYIQSMSNSTFNVLGIINNCKMIKTKNLKDMVFLEVEDKTGSYTMTMYSELYAIAKDYIENGNVLGFEIKLNYNEERKKVYASINACKSYFPRQENENYLVPSFENKRKYKN